MRSRGSAFLALLYSLRLHYALRNFWIKACLLVVSCGIALTGQESVKYELSFPNAVHHEAEVRATFTGIRLDGLELLMSRSSPGRYALHEFAKNVYHVRASDGSGRVLTLTQPDPYSWKVSGVKGTVVVEYTLFGDRVDGTYSAIDETHAHLNLPATLMWARGFEHTPASLRFDAPEGSGWRIATQLQPQQDGSWSAPDLEWMMDSPVEMSVHDMPEWKIENATFRLAIHHKGTSDQAAGYSRMCQAVVLEEEGVFGGFPRYEGDTYTFLVDYLPYASGDGMEHRDSTVITGPADLSSSSGRLIGTISHEFFHSWNVRRMRPSSLEPFDFERANMSGELWFAEGFTNYYGSLTLARSGLSGMDQFARGMGHTVDAVLNSPGKDVFSAVDMSRHAPFVDAATSIDPNNFPNTYISYYTYGEALALATDLSIRERFPGKSLDDFMRTVWREHPDIQKPYTLDDLRAALAESTGSPQFAEEIFQNHILGKKAFDYSQLLLPAGLLLRLAHPGKAWLGGGPFAFNDSGAQLAGPIFRGTPLYNAGLEKGDTILKLEGKHLKSQADLNAVLDSHKPEERLHAKVLTRAGSKQIDIPVREDPSLEIVTFEQAGKTVTPEIVAFRKQWLDSKALHPLPKIEPMPSVQ